MDSRAALTRQGYLRIPIRHKVLVNRGHTQIVRFRILRPRLRSEDRKECDDQRTNCIESISLHVFLRQVRMRPLHAPRSQCDLLVQMMISAMQAVKFCRVVQKFLAMRDKRRSGCPINLTLEMLGDRWSLIVIRDIMFGESSTLW